MNPFNSPLAAGGLKFTLEMPSLPPETFAVAEFTLEEGLSGLYILTLELVSADPGVDFNRVLDENATLHISLKGKPWRSIPGIVTRFEQGDSGKNQTRYAMVLRPKLYRSAMLHNCRIFQNKSTQDILRILIIKRWQIPCQFLFSDPHPAREFCVQYQETDYDFISCLCAEEGIFFYYEVDEHGRNRVIFTDNLSGLGRGVTLPYNSSGESANTTLCVSSFKKQQQIRFARSVRKDYTFKNPGWHGLYEQEGGRLGQPVFHL